MFEIGSSLREARLRQGLDIADLEQRTKVRAKYLLALEDDRFDQLPAHTYIKGFLRAYADALGLDGRLYVDEYNSRYVAGEDDATFRARRSTPRDRRRRARRESHVVVVALVAIGILTALVIAAWKFGGPDSPAVQGISSPAQVTPTSGLTAVSLKAVAGDSFVEVRAGSRSGRPLFSGTLERGRAQRFTRARLWMSIASPDNVTLLVNGRKARIPVGGEVVVAAGRASAAHAA